jgi:hypothetical protein
MNYFLSKNLRGFHLPKVSANSTGPLESETLLCSGNDLVHHGGVK